MVSCQTRFNPSDEEWDRWLHATLALSRQVGAFRLLVVTEGGHPTRAQIERLQRTKEGPEPPTAIVSSSVAMRFMGAALTFINSTIRCFAPTELDKAFAHLGLAPDERSLANATMRRLQSELGEPEVSKGAF